MRLKHLAPSQQCIGERYVICQYEIKCVGWQIFTLAYFLVNNAFEEHLISMCLKAEEPPDLLTAASHIYMSDRI